MIGICENIGDCIQSRTCDFGVYKRIDLAYKRAVIRYRALIGGRQCGICGFDLRLKRPIGGVRLGKRRNHRRHVGGCHNILRAVVQTGEVQIERAASRNGRNNRDVHAVGGSQVEIAAEVGIAEFGKLGARHIELRPGMRQQFCAVLTQPVEHDRDGQCVFVIHIQPHAVDVRPVFDMQIAERKHRFVLRFGRVERDFRRARFRTVLFFGRMRHGQAVVVSHLGRAVRFVERRDFLFPAVGRLDIHGDRFRRRFVGIGCGKRIRIFARRRRGKAPLGNGNFGFALRQFCRNVDRFVVGNGGRRRQHDFGIYRAVNQIFRHGQLRNADALHDNFPAVRRSADAHFERIIVLSGNGKPSVGHRNRNAVGVFDDRFAREIGQYEHLPVLGVIRSDFFDRILLTRRRAQRYRKAK